MALPLHSYASGLYSSRRIARACRERNDFVMIVALDSPDFRTISDFRKRHLKALGLEKVGDDGISTKTVKAFRVVQPPGRRTALLLA